MSAVAWTTADRDVLKSAIAKGESRVSFADRSVEYRSIAEMQAALALIEAELATLAETPRPRRWLGYGAKGV
jgi:hypothetical protein